MPRKKKGSEMRSGKLGYLKNRQTRVQNRVKELLKKTLGATQNMQRMENAFKIWENEKHIGKIARK